MQIIISPAKKMNTDTDIVHYRQLPALLGETEGLLNWMRTLSFEELKSLWRCNEKIAELNYRRVREMDLQSSLTPALISYEGIQYQYMAPKVFTREEWDYAKEHLWILSGFYGALRPLDGKTLPSGNAGEGSNRRCEKSLRLLGRPSLSESERKRKSNRKSCLEGIFKMHRAISGAGGAVFHMCFWGAKGR